MDKNLVTRFKAKSDKEIVNILFFEMKKYELPALKIAKQELKVRKLSEEKVKLLNKEIKADRKRVKRMNGDNSSSWLVDLVSAIFGS